MNGPPVLQVANEGNRLPLDRAPPLPNGVKARGGLCRMPPRALPCVDQGAGAEVRREASRALLRVAEDNHVAVRFDHPDRVREGLALLDRRPLGAPPTHPP